MARIKEVFQVISDTEGVVYEAFREEDDVVVQKSVEGEAEWEVRFTIDDVQGLKDILERLVG